MLDRLIAAACLAAGFAGCGGAITTDESDPHPGADAPGRDEGGLMLVIPPDDAAQDPIRLLHIPPAPDGSPEKIDTCPLVEPTFSCDDGPCPACPANILHGPPACDGAEKCELVGHCSENARCLCIEKKWVCCEGPISLC